MAVIYAVPPFRGNGFIQQKPFSHLFICSFRRHHFFKWKSFWWRQFLLVEAIPFSVIHPRSWVNTTYRQFLIFHDALKTSSNCFQDVLEDEILLLFIMKITGNRFVTSLEVLLMFYIIVMSKVPEILACARQYMRINSMYTSQYTYINQLYGDIEQSPIIKPYALKTSSRSLFLLILF